MQKVQSLVPQNSEDFTKATKELEQIKQMLPPESKTATGAAEPKGTTLKKPAPLPSTPAAGTFNLPKEAAPLVSPAEASPSPTPTSTSQPKE
jgi:hypothetical protein